MVSCRKDKGGNVENLLVAFLSLHPALYFLFMIVAYNDIKIYKHHRKRNVSL